MATTRPIFANSFENHTRAPKLFSGSTSEKPQRKTLQTIQLSAVGENRLTGKSQKEEVVRKKIKPSTEQVIVYEDENLSPIPMVPLEERGTQTLVSTSDEEDELTEADREALELMSGEAVPENYWKLLAEERRQALNDTLEENEQLHKEIDSLKDENEKLSVIVQKAEHLSSFLEGVLSSEDEENDSVDDDDYKTGDEQLLTDNEDDDGIELCNGSVESLATDNCSKTDVNTGLSGADNSESLTESSGSKKSEEVKTSKQSFSGEWVNVELDDEKVASTEIIRGDVPDSEERS